MARKSKSSRSSKKKKSSKTTSLRSSEETKISETVEVIQQIPEEVVVQSGKCNIKTLSPDESKIGDLISFSPDECEIGDLITFSPDESENCNLKSLSPEAPKNITFGSWSPGELERSLYVIYNSSYEHSSPTESYDYGFHPPSPAEYVSIEEPKYLESCVQSKLSESLVRSKSIDSIETSKSIEQIRSKLNDFTVESVVSLDHSESAQLPAISKLNVKSNSFELLKNSYSIEPSLRNASSEPILRSELTDGGIKILFTQLIRRRRPYFKILLENAKNIVEFMEYLETMRKVDKDNNFQQSRWKQNDKSYWTDFLNSWDTVQKDIGIFSSILEFTYEEFKPDASIQITIEEFFNFVEDLTDIHQIVGELLKMSTNCYHKFKRFCVNKSDVTFLMNVNDYKRNISCFHKKIKVELDMFTALRDFIPLTDL